MNYSWDFSLLSNPENLRALWQGFLVTIELTLLCILIGTPLGVGIGTMACAGGGNGGLLSLRSPAASRSANLAWAWGTSFLRALALTYIEVFRAIPLLLLILICYYGLPVFLSVSAITSTVIALAISLSAFQADLVRGSIQAVPRGDVYAAMSLGMKPVDVWWRVVLPHVARETLPATALLYITMYKFSTLASVVAIYELLHTGNSIIQTSYRPLEVYLIITLIFIVTIIPLSIWTRNLEQGSTFGRRT